MGKRTLGTIIRAARERRGIGYYDLAREMGVTPQNINNIENGKSFPGTQLFCELSKALRLDPRDMVDAALRRE